MQPTQLGPYKIRSRLGRGGMGAVYEAEDGGSGRLVAVKTLAAHLGDDAGLRRRFAAEIDTLKALRHPGIVQLLAFGEEDGVPYFAMELVRGKSLEQELRGGRVFTWRETVALTLEIVRALKSAHDHGVVHRDLKPANLLLPDAPTDGSSVKLADFGIARLFGDAGHTMAGTVVGTAEYMAPEQAAGRVVDQRADLYALGLVMFAMLTGRPPFHGGDATNLLDRQRREAAPRVAARVPEVPPDLDQLIDRLLAKDPARRPANALAVGRLLTAIAALPDVPPPAVPPPEARPAIDPLGVTMAMPAAETAGLPAILDGRAAADAPTQPRTAPAPPSEFARARTVPAEQPDASPPVVRNRFTTVEELHRAAREQAARERSRQTVWRLLGVASTVAAVVALGFALLRRPTADELHARIMAIADDDDADLRDARPLIEAFLARHDRDPRAAAVRGLDQRLDLDALERRARRRPLGTRPLAPIERDYRAAMDREAESPAGCTAALEAILAVHATDVAGGVSDNPADADDGETETLWLALVRRQIDRLAPRAASEREEDAARARAVLAEAAELADAAATATEPGRRDELASRRQTLLASLVELHAERAHMDEIVAEARRLLAPPPATGPAPDPVDPDQVDPDKPAPEPQP
jgi:serine/threonine-protein kinase